MRSIKSSNTSPERALGSTIRRLGYRFRKNCGELPGKPDFVLSRFRSVVFVHGCFWHGHRCKRGARVPKTNVEYWTEKISRNRIRDVRTRIRLRKLGWRVFTVWECQLKSESTIERKLKDFLPVVR